MIECLHELLASPLAIDVRAFKLFLRHFSAKASDLPGPRAALKAPAQGRGSQVAHIPLAGILVSRDGPEAEMIGTGLDRFRAEVREAAANERVSQIIVEVDSPGGSVFGVTESFAEVRAAARVKPVVAVVNSMAASAAYWIAAGASEVVMTPNGLAGSIGVVMTHVDQSKRLERQGLAVSVVASSERKAAGMDPGTLSKAGRSELEGLVSSYYAKFLADVSAGRGVSRSKVVADFGNGGVLTSERALSAGMVDAIGTLDDVLSGRVGKGKPGPSASRGSPRLDRAREAFAKQQAAVAVARVSATPVLARPLQPRRFPYARLHDIPGARVAAHEAAHAVVAAMKAIPFTQVSIVPKGTSDGRLTLDTGYDRDPFAYAVMCLAGMHGEDIVGKREMTDFGQGDRLAAWEALAQQRSEFARADAEALRLVVRHSDTIAYLAGALMQKSTLSRDEVVRLAFL